MSSTTTSADPVTGAAAALGQVRRVLAGIAGGQWWQAGEADLIELLDLVGQVRHQVARVEAHVGGEAISRGLPADRGMGAVDFLTRAQSQHAPAPAAGHAAAMARLGQVLQDPPAGLQETVAGFEAGLISAARASRIVGFYNEVEPHSDPEPLAEAMNTITDGALDAVADPDSAPVEYDPLGRKDHAPEVPVRRRGWSDRELGVVLGQARRIIKPAKEQDQDEHRARGLRSLHTLPAGQGMTEYRLVVESEAAAIIDAAVTALSAPAPDGEGQPDLRPAAQRRADALVTVIQRGVSAPEGVPQSTKAQVMVTIPFIDLLTATQGAGITMTGQVLSPAAVRRMACDGGIIPAVLGTKGEILDIGQTQRLFTPAQRRALWHRDRGCTFPGCTIPAQWCDAHHVRHWINGGPTSLDNGALLCQRHHTYVHTHHLSATVSQTEVIWHTHHT